LSYAGAVRCPGGGRRENRFYRPLNSLGSACPRATVASHGARAHPARHRPRGPPGLRIEPAAVRLRRSCPARRHGRLARPARTGGAGAGGADGA